MRLTEKMLAVFLCLLFAGAPLGAQQQSHVVDPASLDQALAGQAEETAAKRHTILTALHQPEVQKVAERLGLNVSRAEAAVAALDGFMLDQIASQSQQVNDQIAGGQTVRLNLLWVIIGLLVLILVIVA